jgi:hypothetical protein
MARRTTIGENPLDMVLPPRDLEGTAGAHAGPLPRPVPSSRGARKVRATFHIPDDLLEESRDVVYALSGPPVRLTLARLAEDALRAELDRLKAEHNGGQEFPARSEELRGGRPITA